MTMWDEDDRRWLAASLFASDARPFDLKSKSLRPLVSTKVTQKSVVLTFDLPYAEKKGISVTMTDTTVQVDAQFKQPAAVRVGWTVQRHVSFNRYKAVVELPTAVKSERAKATFKNGLLTVSVPLESPGTKVKIR